MKVVDFKAEHLESLGLQESQAYLSSWVTPAMAETLESHPSFTGIAEGKIIGCAGIIPIWQGRAMAWAYIGEDAGKHFVKVHREVKKFLDNCYIKRIEATVDAGFDAGHRWMGMLGFELEAPLMKAYRPDGGNCALYARIRR